MTHMPPSKPEAPSILIADDSPSHLQLLSDMLKQHGYKPRPVSSGALVLQTAQASPPDLILLDVNMPGTNGYDVCRQIKDSPNLQQIPILFISGLNQPMDKVQGFQAGGVDYITKPFQFEEVAARVGAHIEISRQRRELKERYDQLKALEAMRDNLIAMIVHDLRGPVSAATGFLDILQSKAASKLNDVERRCLRAGIEGFDKLAEMITSLLDISRMEAGQMPLNRTACNLADLAHSVMDSLGSLLDSRHMDVVSGCRIPKAYCDVEVTRRILTNLIVNAVKYTPACSPLRLKVDGEGGFVRVELIDKGPGIPAEYHAKIFEKFGQLETRRQRFSTGLGLAFCKLAVETHGGQIGIKSVVGEGSTFWFTLPVATQS
jgi:signal transduction histidine kinase